MIRIFFYIGWVALFAACHPVETAKLPVPGANAAEVNIQTAPAGASVRIDGILLGQSPQRVRLNPGPHRFKAILSGYFPAEQKFYIAAKEPREILLTLVASH